MPSTFTLGQVRGSPVEVHASLLVGAACVALGEAVGLPGSAVEAGLEPSTLAMTPCALGLTLALAFVASVVAHELAHVVVARILGGRTTRVTFNVLGGTSTFAQVRSGAWGEGLVEAAGPALSVLLALGCVVVYRGHATAHGDTRLLALHLAQLNLVVALLNLVPAAPLDGGRVLQALMGPRFGDERAQRTAIFGGRVLAVSLLAAGVLRGQPVLLLAAVFVLYAATIEAPSTPAPAPLLGLRVGDALVPAPPPISPDASLDALERRLLADHEAGLLVVDDDGALLGVVGLNRLMEVFAEVRPQTRVREIMATNLPHITAPMLLEAAARHLDRLRVELLPVIENGELTGVVKRERPHLAAVVPPLRQPIDEQPSMQPD
jgi:Zn-dependent protease/CBS domain-containing protein